MPTPGARITTPATVAIADAVVDLLTADDAVAAAERLLLVVKEHGTPRGDSARFELLDRVYSRLRVHLWPDYRWLHGPTRQAARLRHFAPWFAATSGGTTLELGCGRENPLALSVLLYLNGARSTLATDFEPCADEPRAARALYELLAACLATPETFTVSGIAPAEFRARIDAFNLERLREGDLAGGIAQAPCRHHVGAFTDALDGPVDLVFSQSVLEHVADLPALIRDLHGATAPGAWMIHGVDFKDHRCYFLGLSPWAYLLEGQPPQAISNELRCSEVLTLLEAGGSETLTVDRIDEEPPAEVWTNLRERFRGREADVRTQWAKIVSRRGRD